jgi:hypothetical protein
MDRAPAELTCMDMHEVKDIGDQTDVRRVPGGFIYIIKVRKDTALQSITSCFVPYNEETAQMAEKVQELFRKTEKEFDDLKSL